MDNPGNRFRKISSLLKSFVTLLMVLAISLTISTGIGVADQSEMIKLEASDGAYADAFGTSVSISGNYAIVGAPNADDGPVFTNSGCAYIFKLEAGTWIEKVKLLAPDRSINDLFGYAVSISGDYAIVGKPFDDNTGSNYGSAYVYHRVGEDWNLMVKLVALASENVSDGGPNDYFGNAVAINGAYAIVGAPNHDDGEYGADAGAAYIFQRIGEDWDQVPQKLRAPSPLGAAGDLFGSSVAITSEAAVVGVPRYDFEGDSDIGAVYVFNRSEDTWTTIVPIINTGGGAGDEFGGSVAIEGHFALAGAQKYDAEGGLNDAGSARLIEEPWDNGIWVSQAHHLLEPSEIGASDYFGVSVARNGNKAVVGSLAYMNGTGAVYVFQESETEENWPQLERLIASDNSWGFGISVDLDGQYVIVGAKHSEAVYIFDLLGGPTSSSVMPAVQQLLLDDE